MKTLTLGCAALVALTTLVLLLVGWPRLRQEVVKGKQKRVMADLMAWSAAVEAYRDVNGALPPASGPIDRVLHPLLVPEYYPRLDRFDAWGEPIEYAISPDGLRFQMISRGWKGEPDLPPAFVEIEAETTSCYESDMVFQDGSFRRRPEGPQRGCTLGVLGNFWRIPQPPEEAMQELSLRD